MSDAAETTIADLLNEVPSLEAELERWQAERASYDARIAARERLIAALRSEAELRSTRLFDPPLPTEQRPAPAASSNGNGNGAVGTNDAILTVLEMATVPLTTGEVWTELERRGWAPLDAAKPINAVRTALWTLADKDKITKLGERSARRWEAKSPNGGAPPGR